MYSRILNGNKLCEGHLVFRVQREQNAKRIVCSTLITRWMLWCHKFRAKAGKFLEIEIELNGLTWIMDYCFSFLYPSYSITMCLWSQDGFATIRNNSVQNTNGFQNYRYTGFGIGVWHQLLSTTFATFAVYNQNVVKKTYLHCNYHWSVINLPQKKHWKCLDDNRCACAKCAIADFHPNIPHPDLNIPKIWRTL